MNDKRDQLKLEQKAHPRTGTRHLSKEEPMDRYKLLVDSIQDYAIFLLDPDGYVASWNPGAKKFNGYEEHEIIGKHFSIFYPEEDKAWNKPDWELKEAVKHGRFEDEGWRIRKDGSRFWANVVITVLFDKTGTLQGFAKVTRDLTDRKHMEDELQKANIELKRQQHELTTLNQAKDEFISLASHQLRTPATGVKQYLGLILQGFMGEVPAAIQTLVQRAYDSNERQISLVNDLLRVAQVDAGKLVLNKAPTNISHLVRDVVAEQRDSFAKREQEVNINCPVKEVIVNIDSVRFRMVLENLIDNASKYTPRKGKISISIENKDNELKTSIVDNGVGIKVHDLTSLFNKFSRINNELSETAGGSGLGLYWANKVVAKHGGRIEVKSKYKEGTEFTVIIPMGENNENTVS